MPITRETQLEVLTIAWPRCPTSMCGCARTRMPCLPVRVISPSARRAVRRQYWPWKQPNRHDCLADDSRLAALSFIK